MTELDLSVDEELSHSFEPCLTKLTAKLQFHNPKQLFTTILLPQLHNVIPQTDYSLFVANGIWYREGQERKIDTHEQNIRNYWSA